MKLLAIRDTLRYSCDKYVTCKADTTIGEDVSHGCFGQDRLLKMMTDD